MPLAFTQVFAEGLPDNLSTYVSVNTVALEPGRLYVLKISAHRSTGGTQPTSVTHDAGVGNNAFTLVSKGGVDAVQAGNFGASNQKAQMTYYITVASSKNNAAITVVWAATQSHCVLSLGYWTGFDDADPFVQVKKANSGATGETTATVTMDAYASGSAVEALTTIEASGAIAPEASWNEENETGPGEAASHNTDVITRLDGADTTPSTTFASAPWGMIAIEIRPSGELAPDEGVSPGKGPFTTPLMGGLF